MNQIRALLGGNLIYVSCGAAPLSREVHEMLKICLSCEVIQGYGMTEVSVFIISGLVMNAHEASRVLELVRKGKGLCLAQEAFADKLTSLAWDRDAVGTCGFIQPCNDAKLVDVTEMGVSDPCCHLVPLADFLYSIQAKIPPIPAASMFSLFQFSLSIPSEADCVRLCLKGPSIVKGYLHDPENTRKTIDADGWMHTGE